MQIVKLHDTYFTHEQNDDILLSKSIFTAQICLIIEKNIWLLGSYRDYDQMAHNMNICFIISFVYTYLNIKIEREKLYGTCPGPSFKV